MNEQSRIHELELSIWKDTSAMQAPRLHLQARGTAHQSHSPPARRTEPQHAALHSNNESN